MIVNNSFSPKDGFIVFSHQKLLASDTEITVKLYQPLIGAVSFSLYSLLRTLVSKDVILSNRRMHATLLELLDIGTNTLYEARCKLEASGLLRTYEQKDELGKLAIYELQPPQLPESFFRDDLLRTLLLETVGERQFQELYHYFFNTEFKHQHAVETTKHFLDVFNIQPQTLQQTAEASKNLAKNIQLPALTWKEVGLDRSFMVSLLEHSFIDSKQVLNNEKKLFAAHMVYGFDELMLISLLEQSADVGTNKVDFELFQRLAQQSKRSLKGDKKIKKDFQQVDVDKSKKEQFLNKEDISLLKACKAYTPADFLQVLKEEKGSSATASELHTLETAAQKNTFYPAMINILIHYMMIDREMTLLNRNFFEAVISDWEQKGITTPEQAMSQVRNFNMQRKQRKVSGPQNMRRRQPKIIQKETLPDWAKDGADLTQQSKFSDEDRQKLKKRLSRFKKKM